MDITTPIQTIQLHRIALTKAENKPATPWLLYPRVFFSLIRIRLCSIFPSWLDCPVSVLAAQNKIAKSTLPNKLPRKTQKRLLAIALKLILPSNQAKGTSEKLPVTSSRPRITIMTKPTGKTNAPTKLSPVWEVANSASVTEIANKAPDNAPRINRSLIGSVDL